MNTVPISACVITLNEEDNIGRCLDSVQWADELLVVDSGSEDQTCQIAEKKGARVLHNEWPGMIEQKQYATNQAQNDWIFNIDADEKVSNELEKSIKKEFNGDAPDEDTCFQVSRLSYHLGSWIRHGTWQPDLVIRLFNRTNTSWKGQNPHAHVEPTASLETLSGRLYHWPYDDLSDQVEYMNFYSSISAGEKAKKNKTGGLTKALLHAGWRFFKEFVLKLGFLDGRAGIINGLNNTFETYLKYVKLWEINELDNDQSPRNPKDTD